MRNFHNSPRAGGTRIASVVSTLVLAVLTLPLGLEAQEPELVFNQLTVSSQEAALTLEFEDGSSLSASLRDGGVFVDGTEVGRYTSGGALESSWRGLLASAVAADNGQVLDLLRGWAPPENLSADEAAAASALSAELDRFVRLQSSAAEPARTLPAGTEELLQGILLESDYLKALTAAALARPLSPAQVIVGREFRVEAGETVDGSLLALNSRLDLEGTLDGDVVLLGGGLRIGPDGRITGDLRWTDAELDGNLDAIDGGSQEIEPVMGITSEDLSERIRAEVRSATAEARSAVTQRTSRSPFRGIVRGLGGLFQTAVTFAILLAIGLAVLHFFPRELDVVSRTAAQAPGRSFLVGLAGAVLALPVWVSGMVLLAVTVIGIPLLLLWIPALPIVVVGLMILGFVAMSRNVGRWVSHRNVQGLEGMDTSRPAMQIGVGLLILLGAFAIASVLQIGGVIFTPFVVLLKIVGYLATLLVGCIGFGAVLLSRAGRDPGYGRGDWDPDPWAPSPDPFAPDPRASREPSHGPQEPTPSTESAQSAQSAPSEGPGPDDGSPEAPGDDGVDR